MYDFFSSFTPHKNKNSSENKMNKPVVWDNSEILMQEQIFLKKLDDNKFANNHTAIIK